MINHTCDHCGDTIEDAPVLIARPGRGIFAFHADCDPRLHDPYSCSCAACQATLAENEAIRAQLFAAEDVNATALGRSWAEGKVAADRDTREETALLAAYDRMLAAYAQAGDLFIRCQQGRGSRSAHRAAVGKAHALDTQYRALCREYGRDPDALGRRAAL